MVCLDSGSLGAECLWRCWSQIGETFKLLEIDTMNTSEKMKMQGRSLHCRHREGHWTTNHRSVQKSIEPLSFRKDSGKEDKVRSENVSTSSHDGQVGRRYAWKLSAKEAPWIGTIWSKSCLRTWMLCYSCRLANKRQSFETLRWITFALIFCTFLLPKGILNPSYHKMWDPQIESRWK